MKSRVAPKQTATQATIPEDVKDVYIRQLNHQWAMGYTDGATMAFTTIANMIAQMKDKSSDTDTLEKIERFCTKSLKADRTQTIALYENVRTKNYKKEGI